MTATVPAAAVLAKSFAGHRLHDVLSS